MTYLGKAVGMAPRHLQQNGGMPLNESGIEPRGPRVLLLPDQIEETTKSGIVVSTGTQLMKEELAQTEGVVIALGSTAYCEPPFDKDSQPWCVPGDRVIFAKYAGLVCPGNDGRKYRLVHDRDIVAIKEKAQ